MDKITLPTKTKIAALFLVLIGGILLILFLVGLILFINGECLGGSGISCAFFATFVIWILMVCGPGTFLFFPGLFLLQRRKWAWKFTVIMLPIGMIVWLTLGIVGAFVITAPPVTELMIPFVIIDVVVLFLFFIVLLDRKNL